MVLPRTKGPVASVREPRKMMTVTAGDAWLRRAVATRNRKGETMRNHFSPGGVPMSGVNSGADSAM